MDKLVVFFPVTVIFLIALWYLGVFRDIRSSATGHIDDSLQGNSFHITKKDVILMAILTLVYSLSAFTMLGDTEAPESVRHYEAEDITTIDFGENKEFSNIMYFTSLHTGDYTIWYALEGGEWQSAGEMTQKYNQLFKWVSVFPDETESIEARHFHITANSNLDLAEMAFIGIDGEVITPHNGTADVVLFDEQEKIPENNKATYLNGTYFDEIYHPRTALEHIEGVKPYEVSHPPFGKTILSLGIELFGMTPFGWRFMGTLFGALMLPILYILLKYMFGSSVVALCASTIFGFDFMHFVQTRIATIDTYSVFFILVSFLFMYIFIKNSKENRSKIEINLPLALSGIFWGVGCASKWTVIYAGAGLGVIWLGHWILQYHEEKEKENEEEFFKKLRKNILFCIVFFVVAPLTIYYLSYEPYGRAAGLSGISMFFDPSYLKLVIENQEFMFSYHSDLVAEHPYSSRWWQWIINARPILYYLDYVTETSKSAFGAFNGPILSWGGFVAMIYMFWRTIKLRDFKAFMISVGYLASLLPWVFVTRLTFAYHYFPSILFLAIALAYVFALIVQKSEKWKLYLYSATALSLVLFLMFYPVLTGLECPIWYTDTFVKWIPGSWPF